MELNENNWIRIYRVLYFGLKEEHEIKLPKSLCPLFWEVLILAILFIPRMLLIPILFLVDLFIGKPIELLGRIPGIKEISEKMASINGFIVMVILSYVIEYALLKYIDVEQAPDWIKIIIIFGLLWCAALAVTGLLIIVGKILDIITPHISFPKTRKTTLNIINFFSKIIDKYCPIIKWKE